MGDVRRLLANGLWLASCLPEAHRFARASRAVEATQHQRLMEIVRTNTGTVFGRRHDFAAITTPGTFQERVPLTDYEAYGADLAQIRAGTTNVLTTAPVSLLEPTSGSSAPAKLIPYTQPLRREFQRALAPWVVHTLMGHPSLMRGAAYWSVSPVLERTTYTEGGIPIGFDDDSAYLGGVQRRLVNAVMAVPPLVKHIGEMATFRYVTLLFLLHCPSLALMSVWNPTFLTLLVAPLADWLPQLADDIAHGTLSPPRPLAPSRHAALIARTNADPQRAEAVRRALGASTSPAELHERLWPRLRLISCWSDANAASYARQLAALFPQAKLQPKGLIATEAFVSLPLPNHDGAALAIRAHFFEFLAVDADGMVNRNSPRLAHQLDVGARYAVVITTGGGLYRYQLGDVVEIVGHAGQLPLLRFVGRTAVSDWFGEKLHEDQVQHALAHALEQAQVTATFTLVACDPEQMPPRYVLYVEAAAPDSALLHAAAVLEAELCRGFHYGYCRRVGQLDPLSVFRIRQDGQAAYVDACITRGQRAGDVKPAVLSRVGDWSSVLEGAFIRESENR